MDTLAAPHETDTAPKPAKRRGAIVPESTLTQVLLWWGIAREESAENRAEQAIDEDMVDGIQLSDEERIKLAERGQPPVTLNHMKPAVEWIVGTQKRTRAEFDVLPRQSSDEAAESASRKSKLIKYLSDVTRLPKMQSRAFRDAVTVGVGWMEEGVSSSAHDEPVFVRHEPWRNIWYDNRSTEEDYSDARWLFRQRIMDLDVAQALYPDMRDTLESCVLGDSLYEEEVDEYLPQSFRTYNDQGFRLKVTPLSSGIATLMGSRKRVRLVECWYRQPVNVDVIDGPRNLAGVGEIFESTSALHLSLQERDDISLVQAPKMRMHRLLFCEKHPIRFGPSPYRHDGWPMTPIWAYRRGRDNTCYGPPRNLRDPQRDLNARMSKALQVLATNTIIGEESVVTDWQEIARVSGRPNAIYRLTDGAGASGARFEVNRDNQLAEEHIKILEMDREFISRSSGVTEENLGESTNAVSGKAIRAKQEEGAVTTFTLFDNLADAMQRQGEKLLSLVEQFYDEPREIRIAGDAGHEFLEINELVADPETGEQWMEGDITADRADFVLAASDFRESVRERHLEEFMTLAERMPPDAMLMVLDLLVEATDIPGKSKIAARIRQVNGQQADEQDEELSDEERAQQNEAAAQAAEQARAQQEAQEAATRELSGKAAKLEAEAIKIRIDAVENAAEAAAIMVSMPAVAPATDVILDGAGFAPFTPPPLPLGPASTLDPQSTLDPASPVPAAELPPGAELPLEAGPDDPLSPVTTDGVPLL